MKSTKVLNRTYFSETVIAGMRACKTEWHGRAILYDWKWYERIIGVECQVVENRDMLRRAVIGRVIEDGVCIK
jgi:hypothetical protein